MWRGHCDGFGDVAVEDRVEKGYCECVRKGQWNDQSDKKSDTRLMDEDENSMKIAVRMKKKSGKSQEVTEKRWKKKKRR